MIKQTDGVMVDSRIGTVICPNCNAIMQRGLYVMRGMCPECGCNEEPVIIDDLIAPTIVVLNSKGYETVACCSGHIGSSSGYIAFKNKDMLESLNNFYGRDYRFYNLSEDFIGDSTVVRWDIPNYRNSVIDSIDAILSVNKLLYRWACSLERSCND
jgi:hypothetical protein